MKRTICLILAVVLLASLVLAIVPAAYAAGFSRHHQKKTEQVCTYVDADQDGICDNRSENCGKNFVDENGDGVCDNHGENCDRNFTGAGNNGVCDNRTQDICPRQQMTGDHHGMGHGCGRR